MRIQSNISAINTQRQMFKVNNAQAKSLEKLSSGFRINRAADDAAGLAISEKMRSQIRGMKQASRNAQDGISVVQTAEGALDEIHSMLQRMKELAVQSATDSNQNEVDREAIQMEVNALAEEIDSITDKTQFNKMALLDGTFQGKDFHVGPNQYQTIGISIDAMTVKGIGLNSATTGLVVNTVVDTAASAATRSTSTVKFDPADFTNSASTVVTKNFTLTAEVNGVETTYSASITLNPKGTAGDALTVDQVVVALGKAFGDVVTFTKASGGIAMTGVSAGANTYTLGGGLSITANNGTDAVKATFKDVTVKNMTVKGVNVLSKDQANASMAYVQKAIETVAFRRAELGAIQNRIEHTIANLDNSHENLKAAESRVRDTDMAEEIIESTRTSILSQAAVSMLSQANQVPQNVLSLLR